MYALANQEASDEAKRKERNSGDREQEPGAGDGAGGPLQGQGAPVRGRADRRGSALPGGRAGLPEPVVGGQGGDGRGGLQRLAVLVRRGHGVEAAGEQAEGKKAPAKKTAKGKRATAASAKSRDSYGCGACGATFGTMTEATEHALTHTQD
jgi:hypothetical protein